MADPKSRCDKFKDAARELGCEDAKRWEERLKKMAKHKRREKTA